MSYMNAARAATIRRKKEVWKLINGRSMSLSDIAHTLGVTQSKVRHAMVALQKDGHATVGKPGTACNPALYRAVGDIDEPNAPARLLPLVGKIHVLPDDVEDRRRPQNRTIPPHWDVHQAFFGNPA